VRLKSLPPSCAIVMKSGNLKFLESSGPLQACNGTALPFTVMRILVDEMSQFYARLSIVLALSLKQT